MILYVFMVALVNISYAQLQNQTFAENACDLFQIWNQPSHLETFVRYILDGEERSVSLSSRCVENLEDVFSRCQLIDSSHGDR